MAKISKSDQDPHQTDSDRERLFHGPLSVPSQHFSVGTRVCMAGQGAGTIDDASDGLLTVTWDDGSVSSIRPFALNR